MLVVVGPNLALYLDGQQLGVAHTDLLQPGHLYFTVINHRAP
jgi:hypothetical protein